MNQTDTAQSYSESRPCVAVIGLGTAGVNSVIAMRNAGYNGQIKAFSNTGIRPYSPILTSYYAGGEKEYEECFPWTGEELAELDIDVVRKSPVTKLDPATHTIITPEGKYGYSKCVISTGASPSTVGFPKMDGYEPIVLRTMDDAERFKEALEDQTCKRVLISGASMVALKSLEACLNRDIETSLVGMNPHILDFNALPEAAERFEKGLRSYGVQMRFGQTMSNVRLLGDSADHRLEVTFSGGDVEQFDQIVVAHGVRSNLGFLDPDALEMDRALIVDEFMRTSDPDVYAAGDVVKTLELVSGEQRVVGIWKNAARQGYTAGMAIAAEMMGQPVPEECAFRGSIPTNTIMVKDTLFISAGSMELTDNRHAEVRETDDMTVIYIYEDKPDGSRRLVGFNVTSDKNEEGGVAYETGAMLTMRIEAGCRD